MHMDKKFIKLGLAGLLTANPIGTHAQNIPKQPQPLNYENVDGINSPANPHGINLNTVKINKIKTKRNYPKYEGFGDVPTNGDANIVRCIGEKPVVINIAWENIQDDMPIYRIDCLKVGENIFERSHEQGDGTARSIKQSFELFNRKLPQLMFLKGSDSEEGLFFYYYK